MSLDKLKGRIIFERLETTNDLWRRVQHYGDYGWPANVEVIMLRRPVDISSFRILVAPKPGHALMTYRCPAISKTNVYRPLRANFPSMKIRDHGRNAVFSAQDEALIWMFLVN